VSEYVRLYWRTDFLKNVNFCNGGAFAMSERALQKLGDHETHRNAGEAERGSESF
jgi:hypothetical protein